MVNSEAGEGLFLRALSETLREKGYTIAEMSKERQDELEALSKHFDTLPADRYLKPEHGIRCRAFSVVSVTPTEIMWSEPHHFEQSKTVNSTYGGLARKFAPLHESLREEPALCNLIRAASTFVGERDLIGVHAIRTEAVGEGTAYPAPEGIHQDGFAYVSIHLCKKRNLDEGGGVNDLYPVGSEEEMDEIVLDKPGDALFVDDRRLRHDVTPFHSADHVNKAFRDIFVLTYGPSLK